VATTLGDICSFPEARLSLKKHCARYGAGLPDGKKRKKIPIWVNVVRSCSGRCWHILWTFGLF
jgi:hypothetical protein